MVNTSTMFHASVGKSCQLVNPATGTVLGPFLVAEPGKGKENAYCFKFQDQGHLRIKKNGSIDRCGGRGKWAQFAPTQSCSSAAYGCQDQFILKGLGSGLALSAGEAHDVTTATATATATGEQDDASLWRLTILPGAVDAASGLPVPTAPAAADGPRLKKQKAGDNGSGKGPSPKARPAATKWLVSAGGAKFGPFALAEAGDGTVLLGCGPEQGNLRTGPGGRLGVNGGAGKWAKYRLVASAGASIKLADIEPTATVQLHNVGNEAKNWCLGVSRRRLVGNADAGAVSTAAGADTGATLFSLADLSEVEAERANESWTARVTPAEDHAAYDESVVMAQEQKQHFAEQGYVQVKQAVPQDLVAAALRAINACLLTPGGVTADDEGKTKFCANLASAPEILDLLYASPVWTLAQQLLGKGAIKRVNGAQIALRGPQARADATCNTTTMDTDEKIAANQWHIDGMGKGKHSPFSLLVGITLSEVAGPNRGNLCVFPASHQVLLPIIKEEVRQGTQPLGNPATKPEFYNGVQVVASPGDAVFVHQKTAHRGGPNASDTIRYQVYFRLSHKDHEANLASGSLLEDLWVEFDGLRKERTV